MAEADSGSLRLRHFRGAPFYTLRQPGKAAGGVDDYTPSGRAATGRGVAALWAMIGERGR